MCMASLPADSVEDARSEKTKSRRSSDADVVDDVAVADMCDFDDANGVATASCETTRICDADYDGCVELFKRRRCISLLFQ